MSYDGPDSIFDAIVDAVPTFAKFTPLVDIMEDFAREGKLLSNQQRYVYDRVMAGHNIFFSGCAGTGKSFLLQHIQKGLKQKYPDMKGTVRSTPQVYTTALTGIAAVPIGGTTLHSFAGIRLEDGRNAQRLIDTAMADKKAVARWRACKVLIVDEVSMMQAELFEALERLARRVKRNDHLFGGIQILLVGDFMQLPPVIKSKISRNGSAAALIGTTQTANGGSCTPFEHPLVHNARQPPPAPRLLFKSAVWRQCMHELVLLTKVFRQKEAEFIEMLNEVRLGGDFCSDKTIRLLQSLERPLEVPPGQSVTILYSHKNDVAKKNSGMLNALPGKGRVFRAVDWKKYPPSELRIDDYVNAPQFLTLKKDACVMYLKNHPEIEGICNGTIGTLTGYTADDKPIVNFVTDQYPKGISLAIEPHTWEIKDADQTGVIATRTQLPLQLAWAITIHKSQGMSLQWLEVRVDKAFTDGQVYVALSRGRSLKGLRVTKFDPAKITASAEAIEFDTELRSKGIVRTKTMQEQPHLWKQQQIDTSKSSTSTSTSVKRERSEQDKV